MIFIGLIFILSNRKVSKKKQRVPSTFELSRNLTLMESMDSEKQKDEMLALQSIYNEEEFSFCNENGTYHCIFKIHLNLPQGYYVTYKDLRYPGKVGRKVDISYLPPLCLYATLPQDYPSVSLPTFTLCSSWLHPCMLTMLCTELDELWEKNRGQEILFTWIAFLQEETLEFLNIAEHLNMDHIFTMYTRACEMTQSPQRYELDTFEKQCTSKRVTSELANKQKADDSRAVLDHSINRNPIQALISYNDKQAQIEFKKNVYCCKICYTEKMGEQCTQFSPCGHIFCKDCVSEYFRVRIDDGNVLNICCLEEKCTSEATPGQIKILVSPGLFSKYDSALLNIALNTMTDIIYCPRLHCQYPVTKEPNEEVANCPVCDYAFCVYCKSISHGIEPCKMRSVNSVLNEYQTASASKKLELERRYGKKQIQTLIDNSLSESWINDNSRKCPHCNAAIEKIDGCNKMTCWRCNTFFCWTCNMKLNRLNPYSHYSDSRLECFNQLYGTGQANDEFEDNGFELAYGFNYYM